MPFPLIPLLVVIAAGRKTMGDVYNNPALFDFASSGQSSSQYGPL